MKNKVIQIVLLSSLLSLMIACSPKKVGSQATLVDTAQIKQEIQAKENEFAALYNARELKSIGYYADDAISFSQNKAPLVGKTAIVDYYIANMDSVSKSNKISFTTNEVFVSDEGNQVIEIGYYKVVDAANTTINSGNYMSLFVKRDGKYVSLRDMSTSDRPLDP
jgi:ketosteroid isomerase-like protein